MTRSPERLSALARSTLASAPSRARSAVVAADTGTRRVIVVKEHSLVTMARGAVLRAFNEPLTLEEAPVLDPEPGALIARIEMGDLRHRCPPPPRKSADPNAGDSRP